MLRKRWLIFLTISSNVRETNAKPTGQLRLDCQAQLPFLHVSECTSDVCVIDTISFAVPKSSVSLTLWHQVVNTCVHSIRVAVRVARAAMQGHSISHRTHGS